MAGHGNRRPVFVSKATQIPTLNQALVLRCDRRVDVGSAILVRRRKHDILSGNPGLWVEYKHSLRPPLLNSHLVAKHAVAKLRKVASASWARTEPSHSIE